MPRIHWCLETFHRGLRVHDTKLAQAFARGIAMWEVQKEYKSSWVTMAGAHECTPSMAMKHLLTKHITKEAFTKAYRECTKCRTSKGLHSFKEKTGRKDHRCREETKERKEMTLVTNQENKGARRWALAAGTSLWVPSLCSFTI